MLSHTPPRHVLRRWAGESRADRVASGTRRALAVAVSAAVVVGGILGAGAATAAPSDARDDGLVARYTFDETSGDVARNTADGSDAAGDPFDATVRNYTASQRAEAGTLQFTGGAKTSTGNWVELPDDLLKSATSATVSIDVKADAAMLTSNHFLWNIGNDTTQQYWFANVRAPRSGITTGSAGGEKNATAYPVKANRWHSLTAVIDADADTLTFYTDGQLSGIAKTTLTPADIPQTLNTIGRAPWPDALFKGTVGAFHVYDRALSSGEVVSLSESDATVHQDALRAVADAKAAAIDLGDTSAVTGDLDLGLFGIREISWSSSDNAVVSADGVVTRPTVGEPAATVTLSATTEARGVGATAPRTFRVVVPALTAADVAADRDGLRVPAVVRGNVTLASRGDKGAPVAWTSSAPTVISDRAVGAASAGVVTRPAWGATPTPVTLTATVGAGAAAVTRSFAVTVEPAQRPAVDNRYMFAYFTANTIDGEKISLAASQGNSAMTWDVLNNGTPILSSTQGTRGLRDPFVIRSAEGDRFFLIATDLSIGGGTTWESSLDDGSRHLEIWESTDLKNWSAQRHVPVSGPFASMTWAPEAYYDANAGEYVVYWSSRVFLDATRPYDKAGTPDYTYSKVMYATTRDFVTFSDAKIWQDVGDRIDSTMIEDDGTFYRFTKEVTGCEDIVQESASSLYAPSVPGNYGWATDATCVSKTARATGSTTEGPTIFRANAGDTSLPAGVAEGFYLFVDDFAGQGYLPLFTESLAAPAWRAVAGALPKSRHGSVMPVTLNQWEFAKGSAATRTATTTSIDDVASGAVLEPGARVTARVTADDGGAVAGTVRFAFGDTAVDARVISRDGAFVAEAVVPNVSGDVRLSAAYQGLDVLSGSASAPVDVRIGSAAAPRVDAFVSSRCIAGKVTVMLKVTNAGSVPVSVVAASAYGTKTIPALGVGSTATAAFSTRAAAILAGSMSLRVDGAGQSRELTVPIEAHRCS
ncbi:immunoglobulin-like domain-containing protein [Microbacterium sp. VKM Ac-2923]|uniref:immunoglobulin-like domain-containing protein n=1 Tax=Microbacterium sp. VKM Ac-2923 TaxID=2929476 RepID=UPI001FB2FA4C|nr:immunoglobulin-like domain-containing protein [Microbacterium sp. VKM Ac-2923]MCJ1706030.1 1,4-beta-xylanase [Microbacterium sp. VKM Ac-2923]